MPTSEERREVAERLRELVRVHDAVQCDKVAHVLGLEYEVHGCIAAFNREDVTALADLIDPTCNIDVIDTGEMADYDCREHIMHCEKCGARLLLEHEFVPRFMSKEVHE